jgi:hypothetical protein
MNAFITRVLEKVTSAGIREYTFKSWSVPGKVTSEAVGLLPVPGADAEKILGRVMDVGRYVGNVDHVVESRAIADPRYVMPKAVRFYQRVKLPLLGDVHQELVLERIQASGFEIAVWELLAKETEALSAKVGIRSAYSDGGWLVAPGVVGYALSTCPKREDVGLLKWKALTTGAEVAASKLIRENIEGMVRWANRS